MESTGRRKKSLTIPGLLIGFVLIGLVVYYFYPFSPLKEPPATISPEAQKPSPLELDKKIIETKEGKEPAPAPSVLPKDSDSLVEQLAQGLSSHPKVAEWLKIKALIRRITAATDNIAQGKSPQAHLGFLDPKKPFIVKKVDGKPYLDPQSYQRYNLISEVIHSINVETAVKIFKQLKPLFQEAYRDLGYPKRDFQDTLIRACVELLDVPMVEGDILLEEGIGVYYVFDEDLEDLSDAQKHLLRMGPANTRKIQKKIKEFAIALGVPGNQLPTSQLYKASKK